MKIENTKFYFLIFFLLAFLTYPSFGARVFDLERDFSSFEARLDILLNPNLEEFMFTTYIIEMDDAGLMTLALLKMAADRGVKVSGIVDARFSGKIGNSEKNIIHFLKNSNIDIRFYNPIILNFNLLKGNFLNSFDSFNRRMHSKLILAKFKKKSSFDDEIHDLVLIGDKNIASDYFAFSNSLESKRGREIVVESNKFFEESVTYFNEEFDSLDKTNVASTQINASYVYDVEKKLSIYYDWIKNYVRKREHLRNWMRKSFQVDDSQLKLISDSSETTYMQILLKLREANAGEDVLIENSYFVLEPELIKTLEILKKKGCRVTLLTNLPQFSDVSLIRESFKVDIEKIVSLGVNLLFISDPQKITHAKLIAFGNYTFIGSANFDPRSLKLNAEVMLEINDPQISSYYKERILTRARSTAIIGSYNGKIFDSSVPHKHSVELVLKRIKQFFLNSSSFQKNKMELNQLRRRFGQKENQCLAYYESSIVTTNNFLRKLFVEKFRKYF